MFLSYSYNEFDHNSGTVQFESSDEENSEKESNDPTFADPGPGPNKKRGVKNVITEELAQAFDAAQVSVNDATVILTAAAVSFGIDIKDVNINRSTMHREREEHRSNKATETQENFQPDEDEVLTVHWDGKVVPELTGNHSIDREAILVTGRVTNQLLGVPGIPKGKGKGKAIGEAVVKYLVIWKVDGQVRAMSFDTTGVNTGKKYGFKYFNTSIQ